MRMFHEGDTSKAVCEDCCRVVPTTFVRRDVPFIDGSATARNILVGACDACGSTVAIPAQSTPAVSKARKQALESIEANLPAIYLDVLDCAVHAIDHLASTDFRRVLLTYFVHKAARRRGAAAKIKTSHMKAVVQFPEVRGGSRRRLSMKVPSRISEDFHSLTSSTELNTTEILKSVVFEIRSDVLERPKADLMAELRTLSAISA